jgi:hypothetical protein
VILPTSTSSLPVNLRIPARAHTTVADCLDVLKRELGLPSSPLDLVGPSTRQNSSRSRSDSRTGIGDTEIRWAVRLGSDKDGPKLGLEEKILDVCGAEGKGKGMRVVHVSIDEEWLFEVSPYHASIKKPKGDKDSQEAELGGATTQEVESEEDKEDTLRAGVGAAQHAGTPTPKSPESSKTPILPTTANHQSRLSGLFHPWVDTGQQAAPPPTPQLTLVTGQTDADLTDALHLAKEDEVYGSDSSDLDTPTKRHIIDQSRPTPSPNVSSSRTSSLRPFISLSTATGSSFTRLLSQNTGASASSTPSSDTWGSRFALPSLGLGTWGSPVVTPVRDSERVESDFASLRSGQTSLAGSMSRPLEKQVTGGLWSWWTGADKPEEGSVEAYVEGLRHESVPFFFAQ